jgi:hypothetical protein
MEEHWLDCMNVEGPYQVSDMGRVRRTPGSRYSWGKEEIAPYKNRDGYLYVKIGPPGMKKNHAVHRLVTEAFTGPLLAGMTTNHVNGNKCDNRPENLSYATRSENMRHAVETGLIPTNYGRVSGTPRNKLTTEIVIQIKRRLQEGALISELSAEYGVSRTTVSHIVHGRNWSHVKSP